MTNPHFQNLAKSLLEAPEGVISDTKEIESLLSQAWDEIGSREGGMQGYKLHDRMEEVEWHPPQLTFWIERHGGMQYGSTRAQMQQWCVDFENQTFDLCGHTHRQKVTQSKRFYAKDWAQKIYDAIQQRDRTSPYLAWKDDETVQVLVTKIIPTGNEFKETLIGRRKRFREELLKLMQAVWTSGSRRDEFVRRAL